MHSVRWKEERDPLIDKQPNRDENEDQISIKLGNDDESTLECHSLGEEEKEDLLNLGEDTASISQSGLVCDSFSLVRQDNDHALMEVVCLV